MAMTLPRGSIMEWTRGSTLCVPTEHNRAPVNVDFNRIEDADRMANATMRGYFVADKRTWSTSWTDLPAPTSETVDGKAGGSEMEAFYLATKGSFVLTIKHSDSELNYSVPVKFASFSKSHERRGVYDMWSLSVTLEEI